MHHLLQLLKARKQYQVQYQENNWPSTTVTPAKPSCLEYSFTTTAALAPTFNLTCTSTTSPKPITSEYILETSTTSPATPFNRVYTYTSTFSRPEKFETALFYSNATNASRP